MQPEQPIQPQQPAAPPQPTDLSQPVDPTIQPTPPQPIDQTPVVEPVAPVGAQPAVFAPEQQPIQPPAASPTVGPSTAPAPDAVASTAPQPVQFPAAAGQTTSMPMSNPGMQPSPPAVIGAQPIPAGGYAPKGGNGMAKKGGIAGSILTLVIAAAVLGYNYLYVPSLTKVSVNDLTEITEEKTTFKYPKQWKKMEEKNTYGDLLGKDKTSTALITVDKAGYVRSGILSQPESTITKIRQSIIASLSDSAIKNDLSGVSGCQNVKNIEKTEYTNKSDKTIGLVKMTAECNKNSTDFRFIAVLVIGDDGYMRSGTVAATVENWNKNKDVYDTMLDSVKQGT